MAIKVIQEFLVCGYPFSGDHTKRCRFKAEGIIRRDESWKLSLPPLGHMMEAHGMSLDDATSAVYDPSELLLSKKFN